MIDYLNPDVPGRLPVFAIPLVQATSQTLKGYGFMVETPENFPVEIVTWPATGWRPVDDGTGNQGGTARGVFEFWWEGDYLFGKNSAVGDEYLLGWSRSPEEATQDPDRCDPQDQILLWHANYHPDGGQLFFPRDGTPFICPLALPGDDVQPNKFTAFYFDGTRGLYIHPNIWHEGIFPLAGRGRFYDEQGRVHARVSCNFPREFGVFLSVPLRKPAGHGEGNPIEDCHHPTS